MLADKLGADIEKAVHAGIDTTAKKYPAASDSGIRIAVS